MLLLPVRDEIRSKELNKLSCAKKEKKNTACSKYVTEWKKKKGKQMPDVKCIHLFRELQTNKQQEQQQRLKYRTIKERTGAHKQPVSHFLITVRSLETKQRDVSRTWIITTLIFIFISTLVRPQVQSSSSGGVAGITERRDSWVVTAASSGRDTPKLRCSSPHSSSTGTPALTAELLAVLNNSRYFPSSSPPTPLPIHIAGLMIC